MGDELTLMGSGRDGSFAAAVATVVGILDAGNPEMNRSLAEMPLGLLPGHLLHGVGRTQRGDARPGPVPDPGAPGAGRGAPAPPERTWWSSTGTS